jgi:nucleoside-diphosphate-sugar epimerase
MYRRVPDLTKIKKLIGYRPTRNLDQILADILSEQAATRVL